ncbi:MAG: hypothetical protein LWW77_03375 [Propionibacteriales bacterium]|nr:hypothetical protein [Propionibacteriales bacterium]
MLRKGFLVALAVVLTLLGASISGCAATGDQSAPPLRVLFIGNSYTFYNAGIDGDLHGLAPRTETARAAQGGYTLSMHLTDTGTLNLLDDGWDIVILQEQSQRSVLDYAGFAGAVRTFVPKIRAQGARPYLLMTWARPDTKGVTTAALRSAADSAAKTAGIGVIPAGVAFGDSLSTRPSIPLNIADGHPTREGTYLAACTVYAVLFGKSPVGNTYTSGLDPAVAASLQQAAAKAAGQ